jgi:hypothetical protein
MMEFRAAGAFQFLIAQSHEDAKKMFALRAFAPSRESS